MIIFDIAKLSPRSSVHVTVPRPLVHEHVLLFKSLAYKAGEKMLNMVFDWWDSLPVDKFTGERIIYKTVYCNTQCCKSRGKTVPK